MTWLLSKITGNPYILIALLAGAFLLGGSAAWKIQGVRITAAEQEHTQYVQDQTTLRQEAIAEADRKREAHTKEYAHLERSLNDEIISGAVYKRCVAAGRCGVRVVSSCPAAALPATSGVNETRADAVPLAGESAALANECAETTLMLNSLQQGIEGQAGY